MYFLLIITANWKKMESLVYKQLSAVISIKDINFIDMIVNFMNKYYYENVKQLVILPELKIGMHINKKYQIITTVYETLYCHWAFNVHCLGDYTILKIIH